MQITQCPDCHTAFKVTPEHLAVANGWVRCGRCGAVFEALKHSASEQDEDTTPAKQPQRAEEPTPGPSQTPSQTPSPSQTPAPSQTTPLTPTNVPAAAPKNDIDAFHDSLMNFVPGMLSGDAPGHSSHTSPSSHESDAEQASRAVAAHAFVNASANVAARRTSVRRAWWWLVLSGVLGLGLALQSVLWHRNILVAQEPALEGLIEGLCAPFGCEWHWPQTLDAVQIENSSFTENADGTYRLQLRLKNTQHHAVAMPLLELTLTDERDEVVLRRVFQPSELGLKDHLAALRDARSTLNFDLDDNLKPRVVGFRALIFYP